MALALFFIGFILIITGVKGTQSQLSQLLVSEFTGTGNFWSFIAGIFFLGALGYYPPLRNTSRMLIGLVLLVLILSNGGFWQNLVSAVNNPVPAVRPDLNKVPAAVDIKEAGKTIGDVSKFVEGLSSNNQVGGGGGGGLGSIGNIIGAIGSFL